MRTNIVEFIEFYKDDIYDLLVKFKDIELEYKEEFIDNSSPINKITNIINSKKTKQPFNFESLAKLSNHKIFKKVSYLKIDRVLYQSDNTSKSIKYFDYLFDGILSISMIRLRTIDNEECNFLKVSFNDIQYDFVLISSLQMGVMIRKDDISYNIENYKDYSKEEVILSCPFSPYFDVEKDFYE